ncbi:hypothetical protein M0R72_10490 [Candidatus Pacearchaeota archaeon]|jgi:hypothetical protein|nr:hypothetical protein [Candidatus Pacearchaeota archaeon]
MIRLSRLDPLILIHHYWPNIKLYNKQIEIIDSVWNNDETVVVAGNELGKDFIAGLIVPVFFLTRHPCRIVTTSVDHQQLEGVMWGEIRRFIQNAAYPLDSDHGGPLLINHMHIRRVIDGRVCATSYIIGRVAAKGEGMLGHHCNFPECCGIQVPQDGTPRTLFVADEASGVDNLSYERAGTWAKRILSIGNPFPCENFFKDAVEGGDILAS